MADCWKIEQELSGACQMVLPDAYIARRIRELSLNVADHDAIIAIQLYTLRLAIRRVSQAKTMHIDANKAT